MIGSELLHQINLRDEAQRLSFSVIKETDEGFGGRDQRPLSGRRLNGFSILTRTVCSRKRERERESRNACFSVSCLFDYNLISFSAKHSALILMSNHLHSKCEQQAQI